MPRTKEVEMYGKFNGRLFKATFEPNEGETCIEVIERAIKQFEKAGVELVDSLTPPTLPTLPAPTQPARPAQSYPAPAAKPVLSRPAPMPQPQKQNQSLGFNQQQNCPNCGALVQEKRGTNQQTGRYWRGRFCTQCDYKQWLKG